MKTILLLLTTLTVLFFMGCTTGRGGTSDEYDRDNGYGTGPAASPTFRPGMNPSDIRDPNALIHPVPPPATYPP